MMRYLFLVASCAVLFTSCRTQHQIIDNYLDKVRDTTVRPMTLTEPTIQKNDLLHIQVYSAATDPSVDLPYNLPGTSAAPGGASSGSVQGFLVDADGNIDYPRLGTIKVEGLTKTELATIIKSKLQGKLTNPTVIIRFVSYRITVLGEVRTPGVMDVPTEKVTILEALGMAGDITEFGKKTEVKVLRENNGRREIGIIDLTSSSLFNSPYYILQQNDVVMVEQSRRKLQQAEEQRTAQRVGIAASIVTTVVLLVTIFK